MHQLPKFPPLDWQAEARHDTFKQFLASRFSASQTLSSSTRRPHSHRPASPRGARLSDPELTNKVTALLKPPGVESHAHINSSSAWAVGNLDSKACPNYSHPAGRLDITAGECTSPAFLLFQSSGQTTTLAAVARAGCLFQSTPEHAGTPVGLGCELPKFSTGQETGQAVQTLMQ